MTSEIDSIDPELVALRQELERSSHESARARVLSRLERSIPALMGAAVTEPAAASTLTHVAGFTSPAKLWLVGTFVLGVAGGATAVATLEREPETRVVYVERPGPTRPPGEPATPTPASASLREGKAPSVEPRAIVRGAAASRVPQATPLAAPEPVEAPHAELGVTASLSEQQALLDQARAALGNGDGRGALKTLKVHSSRFPESALTEEREALTIKALVSAARVPEAREQLRSFEARFPRSPLLPSLRDTTRHAVTETTR